MPEQLPPDPNLNHPESRLRTQAAERLYYWLRPRVAHWIQCRGWGLPDDSIATATDLALAPIIGEICADSRFWDEKVTMWRLRRLARLRAIDELRRLKKVKGLLFFVVPDDDTLEQNKELGHHWHAVSSRKRDEIEEEIRYYIASLPPKQQRVAYIIADLALHAGVTGHEIAVEYHERYGTSLSVNAAISLRLEIRKKLKAMLANATFVPRAL